MKLSVLTLALWLQLSSCRRLTDNIENEISSNSNELPFVKPKDWVRISQSPPALVTAQRGSRIEIECEAVGSPAPIIQWLKGRLPLDTDSFETNAIDERDRTGMAKIKSKLVFPAALPVHENIYDCVAESGSAIANAQSEVYVLKNGLEKNFTQLFNEGFIGSRQPAQIVLYSTLYMDVIGKNIVLPCRTIGNPQPNVIWLDPNNEVINGRKDSRIMVHATGELSIQHIIWKDMGPYTCIAENELGRDRIKTFVYPMLAE